MSTTPLNPLHQPRFTPVRMQVRVPPTYAPATLDRVLKDVFDIEVPPQPATRHTAPSFPADTPAAEQALQIAWRAAHIARSLLQAVKLPIFDIAHGHAVQPVAGQHGGFEVSCLAPTLDHIDASTVQSCHEFAVLLAQFFAVYTAGPQYEALLESIKTDFIEPMGKQMPGGKTTVPLLTIAREKRIPFFHLGAGLYQLGWGSQALWMERSAFSSDSALALKATHNKTVTAQLLRSAGLPAAQHIMVNSPEAAVAAAQTLGWPVVVKPADRDRGEGVTINLANDGQVAQAFEAAATLSHRVLVEKQVPGLCHRITIVNGQPNVVVKRRPKAVEGDGVKTVRQLIDDANRQEKRKVAYKRLDLWPDDEMAADCARQAGFGFDDVPPKGAFVPLRPMETTAWGGNPEEVTAQAHPANLQIAIEAARLMGLSVAGVDYITDDISVPWYESGGIINEVNYAPFLGIRLEYMRRRAEFLMDLLFPGQGRIPVHVYVGGPSARTQALQAQRHLLATGTQCTVVEEGATHGPTGIKVQALPSDDLFHRTRAALMDKSVEHLLVVIGGTGVLEGGLPLDRIDALHVVERQLSGGEDAHKADELIHALQALTQA